MGGSCKSVWKRLLTQLQAVKPLNLPRCYSATTEGEVIVSELHGFCDASAKACVVVFLHIVTTCAGMSDLSSKT